MFRVSLHDGTTGSPVAAPPGGLTVNVTVSDTTVAGADFLAPATEGAHTITFKEGESASTLSIPTVDDNQDEPNGQIKLTIVAGNGYTVGVLVAVSATMNDNDEVAGVDLLVADSDLTLGTKYLSIDESGGEQALTATVTLLGTDGKPVRPAADTTVSLSFVTTGVSVNVEAADFTVAPAPASGTVPAGQSSAKRVMQVSPNHDSVQEDPERFAMQAFVPSIGGEAGTDTVDLYLVDAGWQGPALTLTVSPATIDESAGPTTITFTATVTGAVTLVRDVHLNVKHGEAYGYIYSCPKSDARRFRCVNWRYYVDDCPPLAIGPDDYRGDDNWKGPRDYRIGRFNPQGPVVVTLPAGQTSASASYVFVPLDDEINEPYEVVYFIPFATDVGNYPAAEFRITNHDPPAYPPGLTVRRVLPGLTVSPVDGEPTKLAVSWEPVEDAATYRIRWKTGSDDYGDAVETTETSYTITGLTEGADYTVNVAAVSEYNVLLAEGTDPWVWVVTVTAVEDSTDALDVSWGAVPGALHYFIKVDGASPVQSDAPRTTRRFTGLAPDTEYTFTVEAVSAMSDGFETLAKTEVKGTTNAAPPAEAPPADEPAASFVIYHDPDAGAAAVNRYNQAVALLTDAGISYSEVVGDVQDDIDRLAGVTDSVIPRFFLGDPTASDWVAQPKVNNGGLRWLKGKVAEMAGLSAADARVRAAKGAALAFSVRSTGRLRSAAGMVAAALSNRAVTHETPAPPQVQAPPDEPDDGPGEPEAPRVLIGTNGPDDLAGGSGDDVLIGNKGHDVLSGHGGHDDLDGGQGADDLYGGPGDDTLEGGDGDDELVGGRGRDELVGGPGDDTCGGGPGADRFVFAPDDSGDTILTDFTAGEGDVIVLRAGEYPWPPVADIVATVVAQGDRYLVYTLSDDLTVETDVPLRVEDFVLE